MSVYRQNNLQGRKHFQLKLRCVFSKLLDNHVPALLRGVQIMHARHTYTMHAYIYFQALKLIEF